MSNYFDEKEFKIALVKGNQNITSLAKYLKIAHSTLMRKIKSGYFFINEVKEIAKVLDLGDKEIIKIFFSEKCA